MHNALNQSISPPSRADCEQLDQSDPLAHWREAFELPDGVIYLDGNSLGPLPRTTRERVLKCVSDEWGRDLIKSWNTAGWMDLPAKVGAEIATLIGARADEVVVADSTSVNLFKVLSAAVKMRPDRRVILSEKGNFPTDLYIAQGLTDLLDAGHELKLVEREEIPAAIDASVAVVMLTQVDYRTGSRLNMKEITSLAHEVNAVAIWDLAHSAGAIPVDLNNANADFAVGCGYKYLNGGPGAPAFLFVASRHADSFTQPLSGWMGHKKPFEFGTDYEPATGVARYLCGSPPVLSMVALDSGVQVMTKAVIGHGMDAIHAKACRLADIFLDRLLAEDNPFGLTRLTPHDVHERGSQASLSLPDGDQAYAVVQALIAEGIIGDFRAPNIMRFGFAPLYLSHLEVYDAAEKLLQIMRDETWRQDRFLTRQAVT
ncbi:MAG: kynureninase [Burkholderiaceae bacterium]